MTSYNVHIYREMRLTFGGIDADTPQAAAAIAHRKPAGGADDIDDCEGEDFAALVDVAGDENFDQSVVIDFEPERQRMAARALLDALRWITCCPMINGPVGTTAYIISDERMAQARRAIDLADAAGIVPASPASDLLTALKAILPYAENEARGLDELTKDGPEIEAEAARAWAAINAAHAAAAEAEAAGITPSPAESVPPPVTIPAEAHSDDRAIKAEFDALPWFEQAPDRAIRDLAACGWGGDYPADEIVYYLDETVPELVRLGAYLEIIANDPMKKDCRGFECRVDEARALEWLRRQRPTLWSELTQSVPSGDAANAGGPEEV